MIYFISHGIDLRNPESLLTEGFDQTILILLIDLYDCVSVLNCNTHLEKIFRERLFRDEVFSSLRKNKFDK